MLSKSKGQILRVTARFHHLFSLEELKGSVENGDKSHFDFMLAISARFKIGNFYRILAKFTREFKKDRANKSAIFSAIRLLHLSQNDFSPFSTYPFT